MMKSYNCNELQFNNQWNYNLATYNGWSALFLEDSFSATFNKLFF